MTPSEQKQKIDWCIDMLVNHRCANKFLTYRDARHILKGYAMNRDHIITDKDELISLLMMALRKLSLVHYSPRTAQSEWRNKKENDYYD